jgi:hypothetical protein
MPLLGGGLIQVNNTKIKRNREVGKVFSRFREVIWEFVYFRVSFC